MKIVRGLVLVISLFPGLLAVSQEAMEISSPQKKERILRKARRHLNGDFAKSESRTSLYFLRQTLEGQEQEEVLEAVLEARSSVNIRDISVLSGRVSKKLAGEPTLPYSVVSAMYHFLQLGPMICREAFWAGITTPFICSVPPEGGYYENSPYAVKPVPDQRYPVKFRDNYDVNIERVDGTDGKQQYRAELKIKEDNSLSGETARNTKYAFIRHILTGTMQIDKRGNRLRSFSGKLEFEEQGRKVNFDNESQLQIEYTHRRGFTEVEKIHCSISVEGHRYNLQLVNIRLKKPDGLPAVPVGEDIIKAVKQAGYNMELMESEAVKQAMEKCLNNYKQ